MLELDHITVSGDVTFGRGVSLRVSKLIDRPTDRPTDRQTDRQTDRLVKRQTDNFLTDKYN